MGHPVETIEERAGNVTVGFRKLTSRRVPEGLNLIIVSIRGGLVPIVGTLWIEVNICFWSQPASLLIEVGEARGLGCPVVSGGKGGNESGNEEFHQNVLECQNFYYKRLSKCELIYSSIS